MKNCGPARFPAQYARKIMAITVDFFVKPATLLAANDSMRGNAGALAVTSQNPASRDSFSCWGKSLTIRIPASARRKIKTRLIRRDLRIVELRTAERMTVVNWKTGAGSPINMVWNLS